MPIYEYRCTKCNKVFEEWHRHVDDDLRHTCSECQGIAERIVSNTSFLLKGGGWYVTDYGSRKDKPVHGGESSGAASPSSASSAAEGKSAPASPSASSSAAAS